MIDFKDSVIMLTGGTGSFGNSFLDYMKDSGAKFIVYSRDEDKQHDMFVERRDQNIEYIVGDVRDRQKLIYSMKGVDYVAHAAALKHVPSGENFPEEVVETNVLGTKNVIEAAEECGVKKLVLISTDKAVYPINAYGMTKAIAEKYVMAHKGNTVSVCVRFGNVLGSRGSVIPLWLKYIESKQPITITDYSMTRFIVTLKEAVSLALKSLSDGQNGELFVMKPPACTIKTMVDALELGLKREIVKTVIGIRPGEKTHEVLLTGNEVRCSTIEKENGITYARIPSNYNKDFFLSGSLASEPEAFSSVNTEQYNAEQVLSKLREAKLI